MSKVTVHYFNLKALGEPIRMLLAYGGQEFEDHRIEKEDWPQIKPDTKFGQLPMLDMDGKKMSQSISIYRFLGRKYGLVGADAGEDFDIDEVVDFLLDIRMAAMKVFKETDEEAKAKFQEENSKNVYPQKLKILDEIIQKNNGHLALGKLTWADVVFAGQYDVLKMVLQMPDLSEKYPSFQKVVDNVLSVPKIKEYVANAPKSDF